MNPSQHWLGRGGAGTRTHTPKHPSGEWRGAADPNPSTHTHRRTPQPGLAGYGLSAGTNTQAPIPQPAMAGYRRSAHTNTHDRVPSQDWRAESENPNGHTHTTHPSQDWRGSEDGSDPTWLHLYPTLHQFQRFWQFRVYIQGNSEIILFTIHRMENFTFLVQTRPAVCARALLLFLLACACSVFFNAGRSCQNSSQRVLIVLVLLCCGNGSKSEARATPVDDRRPGIAIWLNPDLVPPPTPAVALGCITALGRRLVYANGRICFGTATPTCMGDHKSLEAGGALVQVKWKWM